MEFFKQTYYSLEDNYYDKRWGILTLKILAILIIISCTGIVIFFIASAIINNIENIIITIDSIGCITAIFLNFFKKKEPDIPALPESSIMEYDPITLESTYKLLRSNLCSIIGDVADIARLRKPATVTQMDAPRHFDIIAKCPVYHFLVLKQSQEIDTFTTLGIIQNSIEQRLNNNEMEGITQTVFFYNGQTYPSIMVDNVQDTGSYIQVDLAVTSEFYCKYRERRIYNNMTSSSSSRPQDKYF